MKKIMVIFLILAIALAAVFGSCGALGLIWRNSYDKTMKKINDATSYDSQKKVEDSCRSMIASYTADKTTYETYRKSDSEEKRSWAEEARMRANKTAATYNNFILANSFVWADNVPADIKSELQYLTNDE